MSVDILMYKTHHITDDELRQIGQKNFYDVNEIDGYEIRAYSAEDISKRPERFEQIKNFMKPVELMYTVTDYKACCIAHGMPADINSYSFCHDYDGGINVGFDGKRLNLTRDDLDEFTTTTKKTFYILKRECVDVDISNWLAHELMRRMKAELYGDREIDLCYSPIRLNSKNCEIVHKTLIDMYDNEEFYPSADLAHFLIEMMRAMYDDDSDVFIEFQD